MDDFICNCDGCGEPFKQGDTIHNVGDAFDIIIYCQGCFEKGEKVMEIKKYVPVAEEVEAVLVNKNNIEEVAEWCGGEVRTTNLDGGENVNDFYIATAKTRPPSHAKVIISKAFIGDFVVKDASGFFRVYDQKRFLTYHEEAPRSFEYLNLIDAEKDKTPLTYEHNNYVIYAEKDSHRSFPKRLKDHIFKKLG